MDANGARALQERIARQRELDELKRGLEAGKPTVPPADPDASDDDEQSAAA